MVVSAEVTPTVLAAKNIYAETSWSSILEKAWFLAGMSSYKLIFGSDFPINTSTELFQFRELGLSEEDMEKILFKNANEIFKLRL
jgi:predicted TIM-barrel fold metal-dependent hydrolase